MKVYISSDMEGVAGVVTDQQLGPEGFEYERYRELMTREVLTIIEAAREAGATEFLVSDSHGNGQNLRLEDFPADVPVIRSWPRPLGMMEGIDASFDRVILHGYHAGTHSPRGVRAHTMSSATLADVRVDGRSVGEAWISAAIAGHFGVPVVLGSGDEALAEEMAHDIEGASCAVVKRSVGFHAAETRSPAAVLALLQEATLAALDAPVPAPVVAPAPLRFEVAFKCYRPAEVLAYLPSVERIASHEIAFTGKDILEVSRFLEFLLNYEAGLTP